MFSSAPNVIVIVARDSDIRSDFEEHFNNFCKAEQLDYAISAFSCHQKAIAQVKAIHGQIAFALFVECTDSSADAYKALDTFFKNIIYLNRNKRFAEGTFFAANIQAEEFTTPCSANEFYFGTFRILEHTPADIFNAYITRRNEIRWRTENQIAPGSGPIMSEEKFEKLLGEAIGVSPDTKELRYCKDFIIRFWRVSGSTLDARTKIPKKSLWTIGCPSMCSEHMWRNIFAKPSYSLSSRSQEIFATRSPSLPKGGNLYRIPWPPTMSS